MKRSEMLEIIDKTYNKFMEDWINEGTKGLHDGFDDWIPLNERVLQAIEKAGMLPPSVLDVPVGSPLSEFAEAKLKDWDLPEIEEHVWEPEND